MARQHGLGDVGKLATRERAKELLGQLDRSYSNKLRRRARKVVFATGRRSQRNRGPSARLGEAYCPPRLATIAEEYGLDPRFSMDLTCVDVRDGEPWDFERDDI